MNNSNMYWINNQVWAYQHWAVDVCCNDETADAACGIKVAPGGIKGSDIAYFVIWQWTNGDPTFIGVVTANYSSYGNPLEFYTGDQEYQVEWLEQFGDVDVVSFEWLGGQICNALPDGENITGIVTMLGWPED